MCVAFGFVVSMGRNVVVGRRIAKSVLAVEDGRTIYMRSRA